MAGVVDSFVTTGSDPWLCAIDRAEGWWLGGDWVWVALLLQEAVVSKHNCGSRELCVVGLGGCCLCGHVGVAVRVAVDQGCGLSVSPSGC
jgi:hypothetical protein